MRSKSKCQQPRRKQSTQNYQTLEARNLLATLVDVDGGAGTLSVTLQDGTQSLDAGRLKEITVRGDASRVSQEVFFESNLGEGNTLTSVEISDVNQVTINGSLTTTGNFIASLSGLGGQITDSTSGRLVVGAATFLDAGDNKIQLDNADNDFSLLRLRTGGDRQNAVISDVNDIRLTGIETTGNFIVSAGGEVSDVPNTRIAVARDAMFTANTVTLGDSAGDSTNFFRSGFEVAGHVGLQEDSNTVLRSSNVGSMTLRSIGGILDGQQTTINVEGKAELFGNNRIRLGEGGDNTFNAGTIEFRTFGQAKISENSTLKIAGDSKAKSVIIQSDGNITNSAFTTIDVANTANFSANNVVLGTRLDDQFNVGTLKFQTTEGAIGLVKIAEDSGTNLGGNSSANTLRINSAGWITDSADADVNVKYNSHFETTDGGRIVLGNAGTLPGGKSADAKFETKTLTVKSDGNVIIEEEGDIILTGQNNANSLTLQTRGAEGNILDTPETQVDIRYNLNVSGNLINLGTAIIPNGSSTDRLEFTTLTVNSTGNVNLSADDSIILTGSSNVGGYLTLESEGDIRSNSGSELLSEEGATFEGMDILVGNLEDNCFDIVHTTEDGTKRLNVNGQGAEDVQLGCAADDSEEGDA